MTPFELMEPTSLEEALALLDPDDPDVRPCGGGTALIDRKSTRLNSSHAD